MSDVAVYGISRLFVHVKDELSGSQIAHLEGITGASALIDPESPAHTVVEFVSDEFLDPVLVILREWAKAHRIERWSDWPVVEGL